MNIRLATFADLPGLMNLDRQCGTAAHWTQPQYVQLFTSDDRLLVVAEAKRLSESALEVTGEIMGFLVAHHMAPEWELENVVVAPAARGRGLGRRLLDVLFAAAAETHSCAIFLEVRESNVAARTLYEGVGFEQTGRRKAYYSAPEEDAILYRKTCLRPFSP